ncbi:MAG: asparagine synthase (glutamine-hydrolyzing), partial [Candidatus Fischerbacteria bacterium RBG_13_37_8]
MCGIAGIYIAEQETAPEHADAVRCMMQVQAHRGPDADGMMNPAPGIIFGHRRLRIIDLSPQAAQPMSNQAGNIWIAYNGEIYNFRQLRSELQYAGCRFNSNSDTEVILAGFETWGIEKLLVSLRGMFAFALCDARDKRNILLYLARDRLGIKPLYYAMTPGRIIFASEINGIRASGLLDTSEIDMTSMAGFLILGSIPGPRTYLKNIVCLPPGTYMPITIKDNEIDTDIMRYWEVPASNVESIQLVEERQNLTRHVLELLQETVNIHLISDVPTGTFLSGGMDSSTTTALAAQQLTEPLNTLTITFEEPEFNESTYARIVADAFRTNHTEIRIDGKQFMQEIPAILHAIDQPSNDGVNTYFISKAAKKAGLTVLLSGLGGDELFLGYPYYAALWRYRKQFDMLWNSPGFTISALFKLLAKTGGAFASSSWKRFSYIKEKNPLYLYNAVRGMFSPKEIQALLGISASSFNTLYEELFNEIGIHTNIKELEHANIIDAINSLDFHLYLANQLLRDSDVMGMAHSIEIRVPFLDHVLMEYVKGIQVSQKMDAKIEKIILVEAMKEILPKEILARKKWG